MNSRLDQQQVMSMIAHRQVTKWRMLARNFHPLDLAQTLELLEQSAMIRALRWLPTATASQVFTFLSNTSQQQVITLLSNYELKFLDELYGDEIMDVIDEMPANITKKLLGSITLEKRSKVNAILNYPEETAGSVMSVDFLAIKASATVHQAQKVIKNWMKKHEHYEDIATFFVVSEHQHLLGSVAWNAVMLNKNEQQVIKQLIKPYSISVQTFEDQETVAQKVQKYELDLVPVVNFQNCLVGVIAARETAKIISDEAAEDISRLTGASNFRKNYFQVKISQIIKSSSVWLVSIMLAATLSQVIIQACLKWYNVDPNPPATNLHQWIVTALLFPILPLIAGTCGNAGAQSSARIVRAIALGHIGKNQRLKAIGREFKIALFTGLVLVTINGGRMIVIDVIQQSNQFNLRQSLPWKVILVATITLYWTELIAKSLGASLPFMLQFIKIDPALASVPLVTTLIDGLTTTIFFGVGAIVILPHL